MILYYALGGGMGHISRSLALIGHAPKTLLPAIRMLVSSASAAAAKPHLPCPMDIVPDRAMADRKLYFRFLAHYLRQHNFSCIVMDTFPFGLVGEFKHAAPDLPRILVGRYLRWSAYRERCGSIDGAAWPRLALMIEEQEEAYREMIARHSRVVSVRWPISLVRTDEFKEPPERPACCVVHSGPQEETNRLTDIARGITDELGLKDMPEVFTPAKGLFPLERHLSFYSDIVTGAGYASCAAAAILKGRKRYHLHPFPRRFDDQELRLKRLTEGNWGDHTAGNASTTAAIIWSEVTACSD